MSSLKLVGQAELPIAFDDPALTVFEFWRDVMGHTRAKFGPKRRQAVSKMLRVGYSVDDLRLAIYGCKCSPRHQGQNDTGEIWDDLELIVRDEAHVDRFTRLAENRLRADKAKEQTRALEHAATPMPDYFRAQLDALVKAKRG